MKCHDMETMIDRYLDRELSVTETTAVKKHLTECSECRREYGSLVAILSPKSPMNVPSGLLDRIVNQTPATSVKKVHLPYRIIAAAASIVLLLTAWWLLPNRNTIKSIHVPISASTPSAMPANPWLASSLLQNASQPVMLSPLIAMTQAALLENAMQQIHETPDPILPMRFCYDVHETQEPSNMLPTIQFAAFSALYRL